MYNKTDFQKSSKAVIAEFIKNYPLAFVYASHESGSEKQMETGLLPVLMQSEHKLVTHLARRNPLVSVLKANGGKITLGFFGPQRYISPQIYKNDGNVPTWNYSFVEIKGTAVVKETSAVLDQILKESVEFFEARNGTTWPFNLSDQQKIPMLQAISGLEIQIESVDSKFKLNQNRLNEDQEAVRRFLDHSQDPRDQEMLFWMQKT